MRKGMGAIQIEFMFAMMINARNKLAVWNSGKILLSFHVWSCFPLSLRKGDWKGLELEIFN